MYVSVCKCTIMIFFLRCFNAKMVGGTHENYHFFDALGQ